MSDVPGYTAGDTLAMLKLRLMWPQHLEFFTDVNMTVNLMWRAPCVVTHSLDEKLSNILVYLHQHGNTESEKIMLRYLDLNQFVEAGVDFIRSSLAEMKLPHLLPAHFASKDVYENVMRLWLIRRIILQGVTFSTDLRVRLANTGYLRSIVEEISCLHPLPADVLGEGWTYTASMGIIYACCTNPPQTVQMIKDMDIVPKVVPFLRKGGKNLFVQFLAAALLLNLQEDHILEKLPMDADLVQNLLQNIDRVMIPALPFRGFSILKMTLRILYCLAKNDHNKWLMMNKGILKELSNILKPSPSRLYEEKEIAVAIITRLVEDPVILQICSKNAPLQEILKECAKNKYLAKLTEGLALALQQQQLCQSIPTACSQNSSE